MNGIQIEDIMDYGRSYEALSLLQPKHRRENDCIEGFAVGTNLSPMTFAKGESKIVGFTPLSNLINQSR